MAEITSIVTKQVEQADSAICLDEDCSDEPDTFKHPAKKSAKLDSYVRIIKNLNNLIQHARAFIDIYGNDATFCLAPVDNDKRIVVFSFLQGIELAVDILTATMDELVRKYAKIGANIPKFPTIIPKNEPFVINFETFQKKAREILDELNEMMGSMRASISEARHYGFLMFSYALEFCSSVLDD